MAFYSGSRINTNVGALNAFNALNTINSKIGTHQLRLSTGKRINSVADDPAGYTLATKLNARSRSLGQALNNVGEAKNVLSVAEGGLHNINEILVGIKEKLIQAGNGSYGTSERDALANEITDMLEEIEAIGGETQFNGTQLLGSDGLNNVSWTVGLTDDATASTITVSLNNTHLTSDALGLNGIDSASLADATSMANFLSSVNTAITSVSSELQDIGAKMQRLDYKEANLQVAITNTDAASSRIVDADIAKEQLELTKLQILQQTSTTQLAQANAAPNNLLQLFR
ncbi:MAG: flagellin [Calditrichia bacterium]